MTAREQYTDDAPIASSGEDRFSRWPFAERIAQVIAKRTDPASIVLGVYGPWGDGKTSVLNMMAQALEGNEAVVSIKFNPWHFEDEEHLIRAFFDPACSRRSVFSNEALPQTVSLSPNSAQHARRSEAGPR